MVVHTPLLHHYIAAGHKGAHSTVLPILVGTTGVVSTRIDYNGNVIDYMNNVIIAVIGYKIL